MHQLCRLPWSRISLIVAAPSVESTLTAVAVGALVQLLVVAVALRPAGRRTAEAPPIRVRRLAGLTALQFALLGLLPVLQRLVAGAGDAAGAVQFDYALRGTTVAQQLLIGGLIVAALPDWSGRLQAGRAIGRDVATTGLIAGLLLVAAAAIGFVAAPVITAAAFERGAFRPADTDAVATLVRWLLLGFVAEGIGLVLIQAIVAAGRNDLALSIGFGRLGIQSAATLLLGIAFGAVGVAAAYSIGLSIASVGILVLARRNGLFAPPRTLALRVLAGSGTVAAAGAVLYALRETVPPAFGAVLVALVAGVTILALGLLPALRAWIHRPSRADDAELAVG